MAKITNAELAQRVIALEGGIDKILTALGGGAAPVPVVEEPDTAALEEKANREFQQRRGGETPTAPPRKADRTTGGVFRVVVDDSTTEWEETKRDREGNPEKHIVEGVEVAKTVKRRRKLTDESRGYIEDVFLAENPSVSLALLTPEQMRILSQAGSPAQATALTKHTTKDTGTLAYACKDPARFTFFDDISGVELECGTATGVYFQFDTVRYHKQDTQGAVDIETVREQIARNREKSNAEKDTSARLQRRRRQQES